MRLGPRDFTWRDFGSGLLVLAALLILLGLGLLIWHGIAMGQGGMG